jgi:hypothetical protein
MLPAATDVVELVNLDFASQGVAVDAQNFRGTRLIPVGALKRSLDEFFFEFEDGFFKENAPLHHHGYQGLELIFHDRTLRENDSFPKEKRAGRATGPLAAKAER